MYCAESTRASLKKCVGLKPIVAIAQGGFANEY
jgi:hypothetical protein